MRGGLPCVAALALLVPTVAAAPAMARTVQTRDATLLLDVSVNGWPLGLVGRFETADGRLWISPEQFAGLGFIARDDDVTAVGSSRRVYLDTVPGLVWRIDPAAQSIEITAPYAALRPQQLAINPGPAMVRARSDWGAMFSYDLFGEWALRDEDPNFRRNLAGDLSARVFGPRFTAETTGYFIPGQSPEGIIRLDSWVDFQNQQATTTLRLGDSYTGALGWSRSVRFGGIQWRRDFGLRPDIVTQPMPQLSAGVAAPSTMDLFINGVERYAAGVSPGSLLLSDLPVTTGVNRVRMVVTDATGRSREVEMSFYSSSRLLAPGLSDFSVEAGAVRENYAVESLGYGDPFVSGVVRRGFTPSLTGELHAEASAELGLVGATLYQAAWNVLLIGVAGAWSEGPAGSGHMVALSLEHAGPVFSANLAFIDRSPDFQDVAVLAGQPIARRTGLASMSLRLSDRQVINATYLLQDRGPVLGRSEVATATYSHSVFDNRVRMDVSGFADLGATREWGVNLVVSFPIGRNAIGTVGGATRPGAHSYYVAASGDAKDGDLTWRARYMEGDTTTADLAAIWRGRRMDLAGRVLRVEDSSALQAEIGQSLVVFDGRLFASSRIDDGFTVVDVDDSPGVEVFLENRSVGRTGKDGRLFVNNLRGYEANALSIDPRGLPVSAETSSFAAIVAPRTGGGVVTRFAIDQRRAAVIVIRRADGSFPPVGARVALEYAEHPAVLGYGGEVYLRGLSPGLNAVSVTWQDQSCRARFQGPTESGALPRIEATPCQ